MFVFILVVTVTSDVTWYGGIFSLMAICQNRTLAHCSLLPLQKAIVFLPARIPFLWRSTRCEAEAFQEIFLSLRDCCSAVLFSSSWAQPIAARARHKQNIMLQSTATTTCSLRRCRKKKTFHRNTFEPAPICIFGCGIKQLLVPTYRTSFNLCSDRRFSRLGLRPGYCNSTGQRRSASQNAGRPVQEMDMKASGKK